MSRAYGWNASLLIAEEIEYGVMPKNGYTKIPFISSSLDSEQSLVTSNVLGLGRDPTTPFQDVINVSGDIVIPVDLRNFGIWLKAIFGSPTSKAITDDEEALWLIAENFRNQYCGVREILEAEKNDLAPDASGISAKGETIVKGVQKPISSVPLKNVNT